MFSNSFTLLATCLFLFTIRNGANSGRVPTPVNINKCCRIGEQMDNNSQQCEVGGTEKWVPHVYLLAKQTYFVPKGEAPRFFRIREASKPTTCDAPDMYFGLHSTVIFSNGSLFLSEKGTFVSSEDYCVDKDSALVCFPRPKGADSLMAPQKLTKVRKCCGQRSAYEKSTTTCISLTDADHPTLTGVLNSTTVDILYGFPVCEHNHRYTIVGQFEAKQLNEETGMLTVDGGRELSWTEYCLDHAVDKAMEPSVHVFTCADKYSDPESVPVNHQVNHLFNRSLLGTVTELYRNFLSLE